MTQDRHYIRQAWLVLVLCGVFGAALAGVHAGLSAKIADNKRDDTMNQIPRLVPGAVRGVEQVVGETVIYRAVDESGKLVGWVLPQTPPLRSYYWVIRGRMSFWQISLGRAIAN